MVAGPSPMAAYTLMAGMGSLGIAFNTVVLPLASTQEKDKLSVVSVDDNCSSCHVMLKSSPNANWNPHLLCRISHRSQQYTKSVSHSYVDSPHTHTHTHTHTLSLSLSLFLSLSHTHTHTHTHTLGSFPTNCISSLGLPGGVVCSYSRSG